MIFRSDDKELVRWVELQHCPAEKGRQQGRRGRRSIATER